MYVYEPPRSDKVWNLGVGFWSYGRVKRIVWWMQVILDCPLVKCVCYLVAITATSNLLYCGRSQSLLVGRILVVSIRGSVCMCRDIWSALILWVYEGVCACVEIHEVHSFEGIAVDKESYEEAYPFTCCCSCALWWWDAWTLSFPQRKWEHDNVG